MIYKLYCNLVKAGEAGGILDQILKKLAGHMEKQEKTKRQIKSAMFYPTMVVAAGTIVVWVMMVFVVPQFVSMLTENNLILGEITEVYHDSAPEKTIVSASFGAGEPLKRDTSVNVQV